MNNCRLLAVATEERGTVSDARSVMQQQQQQRHQQPTVDYRSGTVFLLNNLDTQAEGNPNTVCRALAFKLTNVLKVMKWDDFIEHLWVSEFLQQRNTSDSLPDG